MAIRAALLPPAGRALRLALLAVSLALQAGAALAEPTGPTGLTGPRGEPAPTGGLGVRGLPPLVERVQQSITPEEKEALRAFIHGHADELRACYQARLAARPGLEGTVTLRWLVSADGVTSGAAAVPDKTTLDDEPLVRCLVERVHAWRHPPLSPPRPTAVTYPWTFRPRMAPRVERPPGG